MDWLKQRNQARLAQAERELAECRAALRNETKTPLNVSCSGVLRGVLTRTDNRVSVQGSAQIHGKHQEFHSEDSPIMQLSCLNTSIDRAVHELSLGRPEEALEFLQSASLLLSSPPSEVLFPQKFADLSPGVCSEVYVCEKCSIVSRLHAYQDDTKQKFRATDTVSAKSVDPVLMEVGRKVDKVSSQLRGVING